MPLSEGTVVGGYTIESVLGAGGMGTVYRAKHPSLPRSDAVKVLSAEMSQDQMFRARFLREADMAATLDHPNIVTVYNRGETDGQLWIAMQYVAGSDADRETTSGRMTPARAVHIIGEVAKALDYAHRRQILHRDVKPANFLIGSDDDGEERVYLADFGIARAVDEAVGLTQTGTVMASVAYAAPEALEGSHIDHRTDIYALGCALYRLLTGATPFSKSGGLSAVATAHLISPPPRVTDRIPALPGAFNDVIATAMAKDPNQRYQSARELARATSAALAGGPAGGGTQQWATAPPSPLPGPPPRPPADPITYPSGWHPTHDAATGSRLPLPQQHFGPPPVTPGHPPPAPGRSRRKLVIGGAIAAAVLLVAAIAGFVIARGPGAAPYEAQTFAHAFGQTSLAAAPAAVAAVGAGDADAVLSLGVVPVVAFAPDAQLPSWEQDKVSDSTAVLGFIDTAAVAAAKPDVIIATSGVDQNTYERLSAIAPTITQPEATDTRQWTWQEQLKWVGRILGEQSRADQLIGTVRDQRSDLESQNSQLVGKTVEALTFSDSGLAQVLKPSNAADYLEGLGMSYAETLSRGPDDTSATRSVTDFNRLYRIKSDVLIVIRTDGAAGGGGYNGLPNEVKAFAGTMIIVDDANTVAALAEPGGYLATEYLDATLVPLIAKRLK
ncbi:protein kinase [Mycobacterium manitobense]|uniref:non-specific serine/threonine protein kinase n=1 Tax=[Mycobacterium] manitobense TaxID=190147 RepID=A0A9X2YSZ3_9MYCO|nr:serine/threonine-protein kinase [[Mycobacterium] manitobense]MCV7172699.1 protein kinase [[Mycobacterium] manitobense]